MTSWLKHQPTEDQITARVEAEATASVWNDDRPGQRRRSESSFNAVLGSDGSTWYVQRWWNLSH